MNNIDSENITMNTNDKEVTILTEYYSLSQIIPIPNIITTTIFSISTMKTSYECIYIQSPYSIDFTNTPEIQPILGFDSNMVEKEIDHHKQ